MKSAQRLQASDASGQTTDWHQWKGSMDFLRPSNDF